MLLHVIARGKIARSPEAELVARYEKRMREYEEQQARDAAGKR